MSVDENGGAGILDGSQSLITDTPESPVHRIQVWDFTQGQLPDICNGKTSNFKVNVIQNYFNKYPMIYRLPQRNL